MKQPENDAVLSLADHRKIMHLRNLAFKLRMVTTHLDRPATGLEIRLAMIEEPLNLWAWQQLHAIRNFDTYSETPWFNTFQHKFFIFSSITTYYARLPSAFLDGRLGHSYSQWVDHLQTVVLENESRSVSCFPQTLSESLGRHIPRWTTARTLMGRAGEDPERPVISDRRK